MPQDPHRLRRDADLLLGLAQGGLFVRLSPLDLAAREADLVLVVEDGARPADQDEVRGPVPRIEQRQDGRLKAVVPDVGVGLRRRRGQGDHLELGRQAGFRTAEAAAEGVRIDLERHFREKNFNKKALRDHPGEASGVRIRLLSCEVLPGMWLRMKLGGASYLY